MDVYSTLDGQGFVWDSDKAASNASRHVVHVVREGDVLRLISARVAEPAERRRYEND
jgi:uncharacterized DUF497 family protein